MVDGRELTSLVIVAFPTNALRHGAVAVTNSLGLDELLAYWFLVVKGSWEDMPGMGFRLLD